MLTSKLFFSFFTLNDFVNQKNCIIDRNLANVGEIDGFEAVENFSYLGTLITNKGGCDDEIKRRLAMACSSTVN